ncbi:MAG TPA: methyltransferase domain-containing protein [Methylococcaceae bacterium]|jgi:SAM-dependent methyltransferase|nr:methyltransferase domain-containing protein [Methylococcaceae bacterium]
MFASGSQTTANRFCLLAEATAWRYRAAGRFVYGFVLGKLRHDPVYRTLLARTIVPPDGLILDLGCGRGILLALLATARTLGMMPGGSGGTRPCLYGVELRAADADVARAALGGEAEILRGDVRTAALPPCQVAILLDVLLYLERVEQDAVLARVVTVLAPGGLLIVREADAGGGWRFIATRLAERLCALARGHWQQKYCYRSAAEWRDKLESLGFVVDTQPMSEGTPFANILFIARRASLTSSTEK